MMYGVVVRKYSEKGGCGIFVTVLAKQRNSLLRTPYCLWLEESVDGN